MQSFVAGLVAADEVIMGAVGGVGIDAFGMGEVG